MSGPLVTHRSSPPTTPSVTSVASRVPEFCAGPGGDAGPGTAPGGRWSAGGAGGLGAAQNDVAVAWSYTVAPRREADDPGRGMTGLSKVITRGSYHTTSRLGGARMPQSFPCRLRSALCGSIAKYAQTGRVCEPYTVTGVRARLPAACAESSATGSRAPPTASRGRLQPSVVSRRWRTPVR